MRELLRLVDRVTPSDVPVLVVGESGTGKELIARAMHTNGPRARRPFVSENCASVPETLLETTLFGHVRGAFTGASAARAGLFDVADGGTLFLDEIGEMPLVDAGQAAARAAGRRGAAGGRRARAEGRRARHRRDAPRSRGDGGRGQLPRGPALPPQRHHAARPRPARAPRGHPAAGRPLHRQARRRSPREGHARGDGEAGELPVARQRAAAGERGATRARAGRRRHRSARAVPRGSARGVGVHVAPGSICAPASTRSRRSSSSRRCRRRTATRRGRRRRWASRGSGCRR